MLDKHDVTYEEACEAAESTANYLRTTDGPGGERRYIAAGRTGADRRLIVIFADEGAGQGRIITAREPRGRKEEARHRRAGGN